MFYFVRSSPTSRWISTNSHCCYYHYPRFLSSMIVTNNNSSTSRFPSSLFATTRTIATTRKRTILSSLSLLVASSSSPSLLATFSCCHGYLVKPRNLFATTTHRSSNSRMMSTTTSTIEEDKEKQSIMNVAMCQFPITHDKEVNHHTARDYIDRAVTAASNDNDNKLDLIVLPEIWNSPYATAAFPDYAEHIPDMPDVDAATVIDPILSPSAYLLQQKAIQHGIYVVGGSIPEKVSSTTTEGENLYYNTCLVFSPQGNIITKHRKMHLFDINVPNGIQFKESDTLQPGHTISYFKYRNMVNIGIGICYDIRFPEYAMLLCQQYDCHVLIYPGAFNLVTGPAHWELLQRARALDNQCYVITASPARTAPEEERVPKYPHYTAWGHSTVVGPWGDVLATCEEGATIVTAQIDLSKIPTIRQSIPISYQKRHDIYELKHPIVEI